MMVAPLCQNYTTRSQSMQHKHYFQKLMRNLPISILVLVGTALYPIYPGHADSTSELECATKAVQTAASTCAQEIEGGAGTVGAYGGCIQRAEESLGKELSSAYEDRIQRSADLQRTSMRIAQRAWLQFQKADCEYQKTIGAIEGASFASSFHSSCLLQSTALRICQLKQFDEYFAK